MKRTTIYDELTNKVINKVTYDNSAMLDINARQRADRQGFGKYKGNLVHVARLDLGDIERLRNMGYDLLSNDPDQVRRALLYVQSNEQKLLTVDGTPFAKNRVKWQ